MQHPLNEWSSHSQLRKKSRCSIKLQGGPLDHNPRKKPEEDSWIVILQSNSKCLILNDKQMPHEILFSLLNKIQNRQKMNTRESKERKFRKKVRGIGCVVLISIYTLFFISNYLSDSKLLSKLSAPSLLSLSNNKNSRYRKVEFFLCNKRKIVVKLIIHQNSAVSNALLTKF